VSDPRSTAKSLIKKYEITDPTVLVDHLEDFCFELGAAVQFQPLQGADARIVAAEGRAIITISSDEKLKERIRFSIGHELGHFLLHCHEVPEFTCSRKDMGDWFGKQKAINREVEANEFSIELLAPESLVEPLIRSQMPSIEVIEQLADTFKMSRSAMAMRYVELSREPVAVVFYDKKSVRTPKRSKYFEDLNYWFLSGPPDKESFAYDAINGKTYQKMQSVAATAWLKLPERLDEELIMEQTRYYPNYEFGFSLLWIKSGKLLR